MKAKILWSEADKIHRIITRPIRKGKLVLSGKEDLDVNKIPHSVIEYKDKMVDGIAAIAGGISAVFGFIIGADTPVLAIAIAASLFLGVFLIIRSYVKRYIIYPFYVARWDCSVPFNMATAQPSARFKVLRRFSKGKPQELGNLDFIEVKLKEPAEGIEIYTPESYHDLGKMTVLSKFLKGEKAEKLGWMMIAMVGLGCMVGFFMAIAMFPDGFQAFLQGMQQAAQGATGAAPPA